jgi:transposase InsO family protein
MRPKSQCQITVTIDSVSVETLIYIVEDADVRYDLLIGHSFTEHPTVLIVKTQKHLQITRLPSDAGARLGPRFDINRIEVDRSESNSQKRLITDENVKCGEITPKQKTKLCNLLRSYHDRFNFVLSDLGRTATASMVIKCLTEKPVVYTPYRLSLAERKVVKQITTELLQNGIIRESRSPYASPILLVKKKDGTPRLCVDFRALNQITKKERYPLPLIEDHLDRLGGYSFFTTLDLSSGFYQVPMSDESIEKTAFVTPDGHFEFTRMPFGLANAPAVFQRLMNAVLGDLRYEVALVYVDDIIIPSKTVREGLEKLKVILERLREHDLTLKLSKCSFLQSSIEYLGREISSSGGRPGSNKTKAILDMPPPRSIKQVRQFLGLAGYFRKFVQNFASITQPLTKLLKSNCPWQWDDEQQNAVDQIKRALVTRPVLMIFDPTLPTEVHTDASKVGLGGVLLQVDTEHKKRAVAYYSRQNSALEQRYHSYELETLAVLESLRHFRVYLVGIKFKLVTDCSAIRSTAVKKDIIPRVGRWWMELQDYNFDIEYRPGSRMSHVDCLSRNPPVVKSINNVINITEADWLQAAQLQDEELLRIRGMLESKKCDPSTKSYFEHYTLRDGKLHRKVDNGCKWVVPRANRWQICKLCHDDIGHFGLEKTLAKIKENYWFAGMRQFVKKYVEACLNCLYYKAPTGRKPGLLHPIQKVAIPFHTIHMDHLGPFIRSRKKNTQLLVIVDGFTKFTIIEPVRSTKVKYVIRALEDVINIFGVPVRVITDRGSAFTSRSFATFCAEYGVKHILNAVATPRANGQCERFNRTILSSLAAMNGGCEDTKWDIHVKAVQRGLNGTIHKTLGTTPAEVLFGCKPRSVAESILLSELQEELDRTDLTTLRKQVEDRVATDQAVQKTRFDARRGKARDYQTGDLVTVVKTDFPATGESRKLLPKFKGPYRITAKLPNDRYAVSRVSAKYRRCPTVVSVDKLKPWITMKDLVSIAVAQ